MRVTTKIIQNNSKNNINVNKTLQDKLNNQMSTEKKINRPSDDPVVAIRALRLRANVSQVTQYYEKNIPDAESWMEITESALTVVSSVLTDMIEQCNKGSSEKLTTSDRQTILDEITQLKEEVYSTGNADYAGRSVFTGYRTESTLKFTQAETKTYSITEQIGTEDLDSLTYVNVGNLNDINEINFQDAGYKDIVEQDISESTVYRIRLSYLNVDSNSTPILQTYSTKDKAYVDINSAANTEIISDTATPNPYDKIKGYDEANETAVSGGGTATDRYVLIPETGELLMTKSAYEKLMKLTDDVTTSQVDEAEIRVTYRKSSWELDDLKPEHYFACTTDPDDSAKSVNYNSDYLNGIHEKQSIEYDVGLNQSIKVNTTADEVFTHDIGRDVDDLISVMQDVTDMEDTVTRLTAIAAKYTKTTDPEYQVSHQQLDAANKALTYLKEKCQNLFESSITKFQDHLDTANYATTNCGTREKKLDLIKNRLMSQKTNFETLQSDNENVDISDVAIDLSSAELTYQAALMSVSKIMETNLMNYI